MQFEPIWGVPIALYLFLAGLGGKNPDAEVTRKAGHFIAPVVVAVGLVLLMLDAQGGFHNPLRFALLLHNLGSVMTWGVIFLAAFEVIALIAAIMELAKRAVPLWLEAAGSVFGVCVGAYTGCLLGVVKTFPLWNNAILPVLFLVSAISTGIAAVILASLIAAPKEAEELDELKGFHYWMPVVELVLVVAMLFIVKASLLSGAWAPAFWLGFIVIGLVGPTLVETYLQRAKGANERALGIGSEAGVLIGGYLLRMMIVMAALPITLTVAWL